MNKMSFFLRQAAQSLGLNPGFVSSVITTLSLTLGALLAVLTLSYYIVWQPLPYLSQNQLFKLDYQRLNQENKVQATEFIHPAAVNLYRSDFDTSSVETLVLSRYSEEVLSSRATQPKVNSIYTTPEWFSTFDAQLALGRVFNDQETVERFVPGAVISHEFWRSEFQSAANVLEQFITINGKSHPIIGVLADNFIEPEVYQVGRKTQVWLPWDYNNSEYTGYWGLADASVVVMAKSQANTSAYQLGKLLTLDAEKQFEQGTTGDPSAKNIHVQIAANPLRDVLNESSYGTIILLLAGGIGLVVIAVTNIANLMMARTVAKLHKLSIAAALGAKKKHIFYGLLAESGLLVFGALILALLIATGALELVKQYCASWIPRTQELEVNWFTAAMTILLGVILATVLAWINGRLINYSQLKTALQSGGKGTGGQVSKRSRSLLIGCQISVATLLVSISCSLIFDSVTQLNKKLGIETQELVLMEFSIATLEWQGWNHYVPDVKRMQENLNGLPEVKSMSFARSPLLDLHQFPVKALETNQEFFPYHRNVDHHYFDVTGQEVLLGRGFSRTDVEQSAPVAILNETLALMVAPTVEEALGQKISVQGSDSIEVIGVVRDLQLPNKRQVPPRFYVPNYGTGMWALIRLEQGQNLPRSVMIDQLSQVNSQFVLTKFDTMEESIFKANFNTLFTLIAATSLSLITVALAALGLFGIMSYSTQMRGGEISTRRAIGAKNKAIVSMVFKDNSLIIAISLVISSVLCVAFFNLLAKGFITSTPLIYLPSLVLTSVVMTGLVLLASYIPLRHLFRSPIIAGLRGH